MVFFVHLQCLNPIEILSMNGLHVNQNISEDDFIELCPVLILQLDRHICHHHNHSDDDDDDHLHAGEFTGYSRSASGH